MPDLSVEWMMVAGLGLVVVVQQVHRGVGASAAILWLVALAFFGGKALYEGQLVSFLGIRVPTWLFSGFTLGLIGYNGRVFARWYTANKAAKPRFTEPGHESPREAHDRVTPSDG